MLLQNKAQDPPLSAGLAGNLGFLGLAIGPRDNQIFAVYGCFYRIADDEVGGLAPALGPKVGTIG